MFIVTAVFTDARNAGPLARMCKGSRQPLVLLQVGGENRDGKSSAGEDFIEAKRAPGGSI
jgi:hypothetical protein